MIIAPRTTCTISPKGRMNRTAMGRIQCQTVPVPEVGSQPSLTANTTMATMATQKSGAEAPISDTSEAMRSKIPSARNAASEPTTMAAVVTSVMVMTASCSVQTNASSTTSMAGRARRMDRRNRGAAGPRYSARTVSSAGRSAREAGGNSSRICSVASTGRNSDAGSPVRATGRTPSPPAPTGKSGWQRPACE